MTLRKKQFDIVKGILVIIIGILLLTPLALIVTYPKVTTVQQDSSLQTGSHVSLGALTYDFSSGKAVKRTDKNVVELSSFLTASANRDLSDNCPAVYYDVIAASTDETQVLLGYGCYHPTSRMFAVNRGGGWKFISPTNHFDVLGIPECQYTYMNDIDIAIAPVCGGSEGEYVVRLSD